MIGENDANVYDFIQDFSSSDYESVSEEEFEILEEQERIDKVKLLEEANLRISTSDHNISGPIDKNKKGQDLIHKLF